MPSRLPPARSRGPRVEPGRMPRAPSGFEHALQGAVLNNSSAYGYSVLITATFGVASVQLGDPSVGDVFLFAGGASIAFTLLGILVTAGFRERVRPEPPEVVVLGSALSFFSVGVGLAAAALASDLVHGWAGWLAAPLASSFVYPLVVGVELVTAYRMERD